MEDFKLALNACTKEACHRLKTIGIAERPWICVDIRDDAYTEYSKQIADYGETVFSVQKSFYENQPELFSRLIESIENNRKIAEDVFENLDNKSIGFEYQDSKEGEKRIRKVD